MLAISLLAVLAFPGVPAPGAEDRFAFDVHVTLSKKAAAKLSSLSEGIVVAASYAGAPLPAEKKHVDEIGQIDLGNEQVEIPGRAGSAHISGIKVDRGHLAWIDGPVLLNVNVYSARRSGPDNILDCDFFDGKLQNAVKAPVELHCSLIKEEAVTGQKQ